MVRFTVTSIDIEFVPFRYDIQEIGISVKISSLFPYKANGCRFTLKSTFNNPFLPQLLRSSAKTDPFIFDLI